MKLCLLFCELLKSIIIFNVHEISEINVHMKMNRNQMQVNPLKLALYLPLHNSISLHNLEIV